eukprot:CAMPEP_0171702948 /NCGR_PEP_ID=MMETSP0991-20121206/11872_1 /TAXON_ID=483369 /ORGANISM="non described non described, Strain CCMP2098" /LENGTH=685 /DNA_ID=CAMNT_0012292333 /DNA_START=62 /DNA_END=2119 /DNA_ORIENTATION=+
MAEASTPELGNRRESADNSWKDPFEEEGGDEALATCLPHNQCLPSSYLSSGPFWGSAHLEASPEGGGGEGRMSPLIPAGGAGSCLANRWAAAPWGWRHSSKKSANVRSVLSAQPRGGGEFPSTQFVHRTSFSCNDLEALATKGAVADGQDLKPVLASSFASAASAIGAAASMTNLPQREGGAHTASSSSSREGTKAKKVLFCCHGSRGDVQPLVALALGMVGRGYDVAFWTVRPVNAFVERQGLKCMVHDLDTDDLMRRVQTKINAATGINAANISKGLGFFSAVSDVMEEPDIAPKVEAIPDSVLAAHLEYGPDLTVTSHCMPAISCAEYLHIPVVYIALQPMYPTKEFPPWAFKATSFDDGLRWMNKPLGQLFMSIYENQTYAKGVKRCRKLAGLPVRRFSDGTPVYNLRFVPTATVIAKALVSQPADWPEWQKITGFLMMEDGREDIWSAPADLLAFLELGPKPVYVGFGSMCGDEDMAVKLTRTSLQALRESGQRGILLGGWAGMTRQRLDPLKDAELLAYAEEHIYELPACPHSWLFPKCAAVVHHGGAGTLAVGLRSGCPTVVCPFIFDQEYFGGLVLAKKCGCITTAAKDLTVAELAGTISSVLNDPEIVAAAAAVGASLREEDGIGATIDFVEAVSSSFPFPWTVRSTDFSRDEPRWTGDGTYAHFFDGSVLLDSAN